MNDQLKFDLAERATQDQQLNALVAWLKGRTGWTKAREITQALGLNDRTIRDLASQSDGLIISGPGCPGYMYFYNATTDEINATISRMKHQAKSMLRRSITINRRYHRYPRKP